MGCEALAVVHWVAKTEAVKYSPGIHELIMNLLCECVSAQTCQSDPDKDRTEATVGNRQRGLANIQ